jgi:hypothetical protein
MNHMDAREYHLILFSIIWLAKYVIEIFGA